MKAVGSSSCDSCRLWQVMLSASCPETGWQLLAGPGSPLDRNNPQLRLLHMELVWVQVDHTAREVYVGYKDLPPFSMDIHYKMMERE
jgi:hypothetical protein